MIILINNYKKVQNTALYIVFYYNFYCYPETFESFSSLIMEL